MSRNIFFGDIIGIILIISFFSCNNSERNRVVEKQSHHSLDLLNEAIRTSLSFDDVFLWIETIPLTFHNETIIGEVSKVIRENDHFYVLDSKTHNLYEFDFNGLNTNKYGNAGQGPGEYLRIDDFLIDSLNQQLVILSNEGRAGIYFYDLRTSDFIKKINVNIFPLSFCKYREDFLIYTSKNPSEQGEFDVFRIDSTGKILDRFMPYKIDMPIISNHSGFLKKSEKGIYYSPLYSEQVYSFEESAETFNPYMQVLINNKFIQENKNNPFKIFQSSAVMNEDTSFLMNFYESNDSYTLLSFHRKKGLGIAIYNNSNQEIIQILPESLKMDIRYRILDIFSPHSLSKENDVIFSVNQSYVLKEQEKLAESADIQMDSSQFIGNIDPSKGSGQQYLVIAKIKL